jgi:hypothetical protein
MSLLFTTICADQTRLDLQLMVDKKGHCRTVQTSVCLDNECDVKIDAIEDIHIKLKKLAKTSEAVAIKATILSKNQVVYEPILIANWDKKAYIAIGKQAKEKKSMLYFSIIAHKD